MSAYALPSTHPHSQPTALLPPSTCTQHPPFRALPSSKPFLQGAPHAPFSPIVPVLHNTGLKSTVPLDIHCNSKERTFYSSLSTTAPLGDWKRRLVPGAVIEVWSQGLLRFGLVQSTYPKGVITNLVADSSTPASECKVSFGEIVSVWENSLCPKHPHELEQLRKDVDRGVQFLKTSRPRSLDLLPVYDAMRQFSKNDTRAVQTSTQIGKNLFLAIKRDSREREAAITVAAAILLAADGIRFKRAQPGMGWRALPGSVAVARGRCSFVDTCKSVLEHRSSGNVKRPVAWSREQLEILRELEIYAASGASAEGTAATALEMLGYEGSDDGAAKLLLDIEYWATGSVEKHGAGGDSHVSGVGNGAVAGGEEGGHLSQNDVGGRDRVTAKSSTKADRGTQLHRNHNVRDWTFPPEILAEARELRISARARRLTYLSSNNAAQVVGRRNLLKTMNGETLRVYCIDDKASRFLDDALSIQTLEGASVVRVSVHVTDVDQVVKFGSPLDELARERGQSLYLPLKPLHMLPAAAMDAASFSSSIPSEAITVLIDFDVKKEVVCNWEVFASVLPPVKRLSYDRLDNILEGGEGDFEINERDCENLRLLARVVPVLSEKLDQRRPRRKQKTNGMSVNGDSVFDDIDMEPKGVASVRIVKRNDRNSKGTVKVAQVVDFRASGAHAVVGGMLTCSGALFRQFAKENRAHLPEDRGASAYVARCGTAPLRRYADLATQRQIKCVLFGRQPAGRRRMDELRLWLARRQSAGERTVTERRRSALFDSLSDHCAQQISAGGTSYAVIRGETHGISVTKKGSLKVQVSLEGTGLSTVAVVTRDALSKIEALENTVISTASKETGTLGEQSLTQNASLRNERLCSNAQKLLPLRTKVKVWIHDVDTVTQRIQASIVAIL